jgi:hypothetical protein
MAVRDRSLYGYGEGLFGRFYIEATTVPGAFLIRNADATTAGEVENPTTTAAADFMGIAMEAVPYSTTQASFDGFPGYRQSGEEGTVGINYDSFQRLKLRVAGGATSGTGLATAAPANILTNTSADATGLIVTAAEVGTVDMDGGLICGRTGNNAGVVRRSTTHTNSTDNRVIVPFPRTIAVGDTFIRVPFSKSTVTVQLTTDFREANGIIAYGTGAAFAVIDVKFDIANDEVVIWMVSRDAFCNPESA